LVPKKQAIIAEGFYGPRQNQHLIRRFENLADSSVKDAKQRGSPVAVDLKKLLQLPVVPPQTRNLKSFHE